MGKEFIYILLFGFSTIFGMVFFTMGVSMISNKLIATIILLISIPIYALIANKGCKIIFNQKRSEQDAIKSKGEGE